MKRPFIKITAIAILPLLFSGWLFAQHDHEFSIYGGGGLSTLSYKPTIGEQKFGLGGHFGLGYHFFFSPKWGLGTGVELAFYNARFNMNKLDVRYMTTDIQNAPFEFRSTVNDYKEKQHASLLQIPLMLQFQIPMAGSNRQFFAAVGGKAGIPMKGKYSNTSSLSNAGYYAHENSLYDTQEFMGFGNFAGRKDNGSWDFKTAFFLSAEAGIKWKLGEKWSLYTGLYMDYGLNNIVETDHYSSLPAIVAYNRANPTDFTVNSIFQSQYTQGSSSAAQTFTDKIKPIAVGIKVRLAFGKNCKRPDTQPDTQTSPATDDPKEVLPEEEAPKVAEDVNKPAEDEAKKSAEEDAARKAAEEAARKAAEDDARRKAEDDARRKAAENEALNVAKKQIELPIDNYIVSHSEVSAYQQNRLDEKIALLQKHPDLRFYIYGHTCDLGTKEVNERVGLQRAAHAKAYMISKGIDESRILGIASKRETEPVAPNTSEDNRRKNRRVEIVIE